MKSFPRRCRRDIVSITAHHTRRGFDNACTAVTPSSFPLAVEFRGEQRPMNDHLSRHALRFLTESSCLTK
jgi:hypothetical protein